MLLSVIITARNEIYLQKTIQNVLDNMEGETEIIAVLDGYWPDPPIQDDKRVTIIHHTEAKGQRQSINEAMKIAKGKFMMKLDAHCAVDKGFDVKLAADCEYDWTVIPRMYNLDINTWKPKLHKVTDYMYIGWNDKNELRSLYYSGNEHRRQHKKEVLIDDTMGCMGPGWFMHTDRFWELGGCDETHGSWGQQGIEVALKAWLSGGSLKVNKKTWFAHWFRGNIGFPYQISGKEVQIAREYSKDLWLNNKWPQQKRTFQWLLNKFNIENKMKDKDITEINRLIRSMFSTRTSYDFPPYCVKKGDRLTLPDLWNKLGYTKGVEVGVQKGIYSEEILKRMPNVHLTSIDPWTTYPSRSHLTQEQQDKLYNITVERLSKYGDRSTILREYSEKASEKFADESLDFVYIDGDHTFNGACLDLIKWYPKIRKGGMIGLHDYCNARRAGVVPVVDGFTKCNLIKDWYITPEITPTAFWVKE